MASSLYLQNDEYKERAALLLSSNSKAVAELLSMYATATGQCTETSKFAPCLNLFILC